MATPVYAHHLTDIDLAESTTGYIAYGGASGLGAGARLYGFYAFNKVLDNTEIKTLVDHLNDRHGRIYA